MHITAHTCTLPPVTMMAYLCMSANVGENKDLAIVAKVSMGKRFMGPAIVLLSSSVAALRSRFGLLLHITRGERLRK